VPDGKNTIVVDNCTSPSIANEALDLDASAADVR